MASNGSPPAQPAQPVQLVQEIEGPRPEAEDGRLQPGQAVARALRDALGAAPTVRDPAAFVAALERSFTPRVVTPAGVEPDRRYPERRDGTPPPEPLDPSTTPVVWEHTPRGFALQVDLGALTGAQASLARRAQKMLADALPLLDGVTPLITFADPESLEASRQIVRSELQRIVEELAVEGGPSVGLVDQLFKDLINESASRLDNASSEGGGADRCRTPAEEVGGQLGLLRDRFGFNRDCINTLQEEQNFTNFLVLADYITTLFLDWVETRNAFLPTAGRPFFGTQLVLIERELPVASDSVREANAALDAVFIGADERQTLSVEVGGDDDEGDSGDERTEVFLGPLLDTIERLVSIEAPRLIEAAGRDGALSLKPTFEVLARQVEAFVVEANKPDSSLPALFDNELVLATLSTLQANLSTIAALIAELGEPQPLSCFSPLPPEEPGSSGEQPDGVIILNASGIRPTATGRLLIDLEGDNLSRTQVFARQGDHRVRARLSGDRRRLQAQIDLSQLRPGPCQLVATRNGVDSVIDQLNIGP